MGLVHQQQRIAGFLEKTPQMDPGIKRIIIIADHHVALLRYRQRQLEGAQSMPVGQIMERIPVPVTGIFGFMKGGAQTVEKTGGPGTPGRMTGYTGGGTAFLLGGQGDRPQLRSPIATAAPEPPRRFP